MKRTVLFALLALMFVQQATAGPWLKSVSAAQKKAKEKNQLIFVDLFADWCGWCHRMEQEVFPSETFQRATDNMVLLRLNTEDGAEGSKFAQKYQVSSLPTFLMLTPELNVAGMIRGYSPAKEFVSSMKDNETSYRKFEKLAASESTFAKDYQKRLDLALEFRSRGALSDAEPRFKKLVAESGVPGAIRDQAFYELAVVQLLQNRPGDATDTIGNFAKVQKRGEWYERSRVLQAQIYSGLGNFMSAVTELRNFKKNFPNSPLINMVDSMLPDLEKRLSASK